MAQKFYGSVCLSDLLSAAKIPHSAFSRGNNGKAYANIVIWLNDEPDDFGNVMTVQLQSSKEKYQSEGKTYVGRLKRSEIEKKKPAAGRGDNGRADVYDDLPF